MSLETAADKRDDAVAGMRTTHVEPADIEIGERCDLHCFSCKIPLDHAYVLRPFSGVRRTLAQ